MITTKKKNAYEVVVKTKNYTDCLLKMKKKRFFPARTYRKKL